MAKKGRIQLIISAKDKAGQVFRRVLGRIKSFGVGALKITGGLAAGFGLVTAAVGALYVKLAGLIDEQAKVAASLGISNEALGSMRDAADYAGISNDSLSTSLKKMSQNIADAVNGIGEGKEALEALGLKAEDLQRMGPEKAFDAIIEKLDQIPNGIKKTGLAMDLFGRSGAAMTNLTSKGLRQAQADAEALKLKLTSAQAAHVEAANDAWSRIKNAGGDFLKYIAATLAPGIKAGFDSAFEFIKKQDLRLWASKAALGVAKAFLGTLVVLGAVGESVVHLTRGLNGAFSIVNQIVGGISALRLGNIGEDLDKWNEKLANLEKHPGPWADSAREKYLKKIAVAEKKMATAKALADTTINIDQALNSSADWLGNAQGFSISPEAKSTINKLEKIVQDMEGKGGGSGTGNSGSSPKETAGRIEIAFSGTEKAINIAKERSQEFNDILAKTGGIAGTASDITVEKLGRISSILDDINRKASAAGSAIGGISTPSTTLESLGQQLEDEADK